MKLAIKYLLNLKTNSIMRSSFWFLFILTILAMALTAENKNFGTISRRRNLSSKNKYSQSFLKKLKNSYNNLKEKVKNIFKSKETNEKSNLVPTSPSNLIFEHDYYNNPVPSKWDTKIGVAYRDMAGLGYMTKKEIEMQLNEIRKGASGDKSKISAIMRVLFEEQNWEFIGNHTDGADDFSINVIRSKQKEKVVLAFSGTKSNGQLFKQIINNGGKYYFRKSNKLSKSIIIMNFFQSLYIDVYKHLKELIEKAKDPSIKQYIFVGHSLGGAMASLAVFDSLKEKLIEKTENSPVLITFGQPRVGNYAFANELMKSVPIVYRIVNRFDVVSGIPACIVDKKTQNCLNEFGKEDLDANFNDYKMPSRSLWNRMFKSVKFFPWHFGGLIYNKPRGESSVCTNSEPKYKTECRLETSKYVDYHIFYFGYKITDLCNPQIFGSNLIDGTKQINDNNEKSGKILDSNKRKVSSRGDSFKAPPPFVLKDRPDDGNGFGSTIENHLMELLRSFNHINKRK